MHLVHEKILNFEPLENGERLLSLENFDRKDQKYYYYLSLRDKNTFKEKQVIDPHKLFGQYLNYSNPHKPYYGLYSYENIIYVKSKDGNFMGIKLDKYLPKLIFRD